YIKYELPKKLIEAPPPPPPMVSINPKVPDVAVVLGGGVGAGGGGGGGGVGGGVSFFSGGHLKQKQRDQHQHPEPILHPIPPPVALPIVSSPSSSSAMDASAEDPSKKIRKPYTITKSRESWTEPEHDKFLEALQLFDRDWKKIGAFIGSKSVIQIRSHAQKYFLKVQKNGTSEHLPPPRPKRKASHPYPQKASKNAPQISQTTVPPRAAVLSSDSSSIVRNSNTNIPASSCANTSVQPASATHVAKGQWGKMQNFNFDEQCENYDANLGILVTLWQIIIVAATRALLELVRLLRQQVIKITKIGHIVLCQISQKYISFLGSMFDPTASGHFQKLKDMDPIDVETVLLLMRNLSVNLTSPDFEAHRHLLSKYGVDSEEAKSSSTDNPLQAGGSLNTSCMVKGE
ncbi:Protein REVEILLE 6, partial [Ananas comosus]